MTRTIAILLTLTACRPPTVVEATTVKPLGAGRHLITIVQDDGLEDAQITEYILTKAAEACDEGYEIEKQEDDHAVVRCNRPEPDPPAKAKPRQWDEGGTTVMAIDAPAWCSLSDGDGPCYSTRAECDAYVAGSEGAAPCETQLAAVCSWARFITSGKVSTFCTKQMGSCKQMQAAIDPDKYSHVRDCAVLRYGEK